MNGFENRAESRAKSPKSEPVKKKRCKDSAFPVKRTNLFLGSALEAFELARVGDNRYWRPGLAMRWFTRPNVMRTWFTRPAETGMKRNGPARGDNRAGCHPGKAL